MTSITLHEGAYGAMPTAMAAITTAAAGTPLTKSIETTVTIGDSTYTALEAVEPISPAMPTPSVPHPPYMALGYVDSKPAGRPWLKDSEDGEETGENDNNDEVAPTGPSPSILPWFTHGGPQIWEDKPIDDTFHVTNDIDPTPTSSEGVATAAKAIVPLLSDDESPVIIPPEFTPPVDTTAVPTSVSAVSEDRRPHGVLPSGILPQVVTTEYPSPMPLSVVSEDGRPQTIPSGILPPIFTTEVTLRTDRGPTNDAFYPDGHEPTETMSQDAAPSAARHGIHDSWWRPPPNWSTHIQPSEPAEVVVTVVITKTLPSTTITFTREVPVTGSMTIEPSTLAHAARPTAASGVSSVNHRLSQTNGTNSTSPNLVTGSAASLLPAQGRSLVAAEAIAVLAGFYAWFM